MDCGIQATREATVRPARSSGWFIRHRGLVTGVLTAAGATGQLVFLPLISALAQAHEWRTPSPVVSGPHWP